MSGSSSNSLGIPGWAMNLLGGQTSGANPTNANSLVGGTPTIFGAGTGPSLADAWDSTSANVGNWVKDQEKGQIANGLLDPATLFPTQKGVMAGINQIASALLRSRSAPGLNISQDMVPSSSSLRSMAGLPPEAPPNGSGGGSPVSAPAPATLPPWEDVIRYAEGSGPQAVSPKGATGTMQVMPKTITNPGFGITPADPNNPADVARVGKEYANTMLGRYGGSPSLAAAAYNAGPGKVDEWLKTIGNPLKGEISDDDWISKIPYKETKNYVNRALGYLENKLGMAAPQAAGAATPFVPVNFPGVAPPTQPYSTGLQAPVDPNAFAKRGGKALALLQTLLPKNHVYVQVDHDPWENS